MADTFNLFTALLLIMMGVYMMCLCGFMPFRFARVLRGLFRLFRPKKEGKKGEISPFEAFAAALGGSVGTGNIAGVASAIAIGGPGAVFWMWVSGILGMATKYAEILVAMRFRGRDAAGAPVGGTMYCILHGMGKGAMPIAVLFSLFTVLASLGCGNTVQANTAAAAASEAAALLIPGSKEWAAPAVGILMAAALAAVLFGGAKRICRASAYLVPLMSFLYIGAAFAVVWTFRENLPAVLSEIFVGAFGLRPVLGGAAGFTLVRALRVGMVRGVFSNEAGIGAAPMAYASARSGEHAEQAMLGIFEVFADTILICTLTALAVLSSGIRIPYGNADAEGMEIALCTLSTVMEERTAGVFLAVSTVLFAFSSMLGWALYGIRAAEFLFGGRGGRCYRILFVLASGVGAVTDAAFIWKLGETFNSLMALPNLLMLLALAPWVKKDTQAYLSLPNTRRL